jgi:hypothetical protein
MAIENAVEVHDELAVEHAEVERNEQLIVEVPVEVRAGAGPYLQCGLWIIGCSRYPA